MPTASARHIFVLSLEECEQIKKQIENGANFSACARKYSVCPSAANDGLLENITPGQLLSELDQIIFSKEPGKLYGPIESRFGYHLIEINNRS